MTVARYHQPARVGRQVMYQDPAHRADVVAVRVVLGGLLRIDECVAHGYFADSLAKKATAFFRTSMVCCCSRFSRRRRYSSSFRHWSRPVPAVGLVLLDPLARPLGADAGLTGDPGDRLP